MAKPGRRWIGAALIAQLKAVLNSYSEHRVPRMAGALSYYTAFSIAPLIVIAIAIAGLVFGEEAARGQITGQIKNLVGDSGAQAIQTMVQSADKPGRSTIATLMGIVSLLIGATGVFGELQDSLNTIWEVQAKPGHGVMGFLRQRFLSFSMVFGIGFMLLVSLVLSAAIEGMGSQLNAWIPHAHGISESINSVLSFVVIGVLFAFTFKYLPDVRIRWRDVWIGAAVTAGLFVIGKFAIGLYLGFAATSSSYGAVGSLAVLLIWVYYSAQVFLIGAEFTKVHATANGSPVKPTRNAEWAPTHALGKTTDVDPAGTDELEMARLRGRPDLT